MNQEQLLRLNICPFNNDVMCDIMDGRETEGEEKAHFILMLRYLTLLMQRCQVTFPIPQITECLKRNKGEDVYHFSGFTSKRRNLLEDFQKEILINSGWSYGKGRLKEKKMSKLKLYSLKDINSEDCRKAALQIPSILELKQNGFESLSITVCWNERIARYHNYAVSNPKKIKAYFQEGDARIERILRKLADPYALGNVFRSYGAERYVMGFFEGNSDEGVISIENMDYNFFAQAIILHMLLVCAEELFGLPKWEVERDEA